jgi:hypothetical protein
MIRIIYKDKNVGRVNESYLDELCNQIGLQLLPSEG